MLDHADRERWRERFETVYYAPQNGTEPRSIRET
jgi:hypothetical protein